MENIGQYIEIELDGAEFAKKLSLQPFLTNSDVKAFQDLRAKRRELLGRIFTPILKDKNFSFLSNLDLTFLYRSDDLRLQMLSQYRASSIKIAFQQGVEKVSDNNAQIMMLMRAGSGVRNGGLYSVHEHADLNKVMAELSPKLHERIGRYCSSTEDLPNTQALSESEILEIYLEPYTSIGLEPSEIEFKWIKALIASRQLARQQSIPVSEGIFSFLDRHWKPSASRDADGPS